MKIINIIHISFIYILSPAELTGIILAWNTLMLVHSLIIPRACVRATHYSALQHWPINEGAVPIALCLVCTTDITIAPKEITLSRPMLQHDFTIGNQHYIPCSALSKGCKFVYLCNE